MSAKVDQFCDTLRDHLNAVESRVESVKENVNALPGKADKAVHEKVNQARARIQGQKDRIDKARADLKTWGEQKRAETEATIHEWKTRRETKKLGARADRAEAYAQDAVAVALATIDEAEEAILDAVGARMDADAAVSAV